MNKFSTLIALLLSLPGLALAQPQFVEGTHYQVVGQPSEQEEGGKIEVIEAFWYGCPSCFSFEPHLQRWEADKPDDVVLRRIAASMNPSWRVHARAYYTAEALDILDEAHDNLFRAIHIQRRPLTSVNALAEFFAEHGVEEEAFRETYHSFSVETRMRRGDQLTRRYRLTGVPSIVVAGKYRTDASMARGYERLIQLIDFLVELERGNETDTD